MQSGGFLTHLSYFYKWTESTFYSWKLFTHENFFKQKHGRRKAEIGWTAEQLQAVFYFYSAFPC